MAIFAEYAGVVATIGELYERSSWGFCIRRKIAAQLC